MKNLISNALIVAIFIASGLFYKHALRLQEQAKMERELAAIPHTPQTAAPQVVYQHAPQSVSHISQDRSPASVVAARPESAYNEQVDADSVYRAQQVAFHDEVKTFYPTRKRAQKQILRQTRGDGSPALFNVQENKGEQALGFGNVMVISNQKSNYIQKLSSEGPSFGFNLGTEYDNDSNPHGMYEIHN